MADRFVRSAATRTGLTTSSDGRTTLGPPAVAALSGSVRLVAPLSAFTRDDVPLAGGKGANLGELVRAGCPVPDGFVVTTEAYAQVLRSSHVGVPSDVADADAADLRSQVESVAVPEPLRAAIVDAYARLGRGSVAVRSSATAEDLPGATFAGQQDTFLDVAGEAALLDAVRRCWGSLWSERAVAYRRTRSIPPQDVRIAVVVQRLVDAEVAGVLFTAEPVTGDRGRLVVDASSGLGEAVVSGLVTPDHYVLDRRGRVRTWTPGRREVVLRSTGGHGVRRTTDDSSSGARLPYAVLRELARLGTGVAAHFGRPQDIEWAYAAGRLWLLQARPMTALPPPPVRLNRFQRRLGSVLVEYVPVRPYPIDMTTWLPYGPAGLMGRVLAYFGLRNAFENFLHEEDGVVDRLVPPSPHPTPGIVRAPFRFVLLAVRHDPGRWTEDPRVLAYLSSVRDLARQDPAAMPWPDVVRVPRQALALVQPVADLRIDYLPRTGFAVLRLFVALRWLGRGPLLSDLLSGARTRTSDFNDALAALAERVRSDPSLSAAVDALDVRVLSGSTAFAEEVAAFLAEYGHRETASPILVSTPTLGDAPDVLLGLLKVLAARPRRGTDRAGRAVHELLASPRLARSGRRQRLQRWVDAARAGMAFREDSHFYFTMPLPILRRSLLEIGRRLCDAGVLGAPQDVFHLRLEEIEDIPDVERLTLPHRERLAATVRRRAARRDELTGVRLVDPTAIFPPQDAGEALVSGTPASGGRATGPVRIVREPAEFARLAGGDVLVCPYTNPSWTPLFQRAAAVVVDAGGAASHAAIVAREYGIPAVMGTARGTHVLSDGLLVTVDGDRGRVTSGPSE